MKCTTSAPGFRHLLRPLIASLGAVALLLSPSIVSAQSITIANPHWNITLTDFGYSDFLLDNTPGFQGREYLSGEWGAAVGYTNSGGIVTPQWLEPNFSYPDWTTNSTFHVVSPITQTGLNADNLPIAQSVIANGDLQVTLRHEMLDTVVGTPMGTAAASTGGLGASINSGRYVLKQTCTIKNISGAAIANLQLFQFLHGLQSQRGVYDNRTYAGPLNTFHYDVTLAGVDSGAVGPGSSSEGLEDFIGFHASVAPSGYEIGHYGIEGNGVDNHSTGKPSEGVHFSVENNWLTAPYAARLGTDYFAPAQRWVAGAQRWNLGSLAAGQSVSHDVVLSLVTGTKVTVGTGSSGGCNGGSSVPGGLDYQFEDVTSSGSCFAEFSKADNAELAVRIAANEFGSFNFLTPGSPAQVWNVGFSGAYAGSVSLTFAYDATLLPPGFDESTLTIHHYSGGAWQTLPGTVDAVTHRITFSTTALGAFALGVDGAVTFQIDASVLPANSGTITGTGTYAQASSLSLVAAANAGYVFANWTEGGAIVSNSPSYTFGAQVDRALVANFVPVGAAKRISTSSNPSNAGSTSGDGAYALNSSATVVATANPGYKFSKWQVGTTTVSSSKTYTFTVTGDRALVAKFKPSYSVAVTPEPFIGGTVEADSISYEYGETAVMKAFPEPGYSFVNWTENGVPVSTDETFIFNATGNRSLVGNFALGHRIDVKVDPKTAGSASGAGVYPDGDIVTLIAEAKPGYIFTNWTESGIVVSTSASYDFTSGGDRALVGNFVALPTLKSAITSPGALMLSWPAGASGWVLQERPDLGSGNWVDSTRTVTPVGSENQVTVSPLTGKGFFRLVHP
ncbi:MAG: hypothetical protein K8R23_14985 [Chthoniobacter sp.]|nr:hypothetical protein [Chthoniobacter sp.]